MRLISATIQQSKAKYQLSQYFYSEILALPNQKELDAGRTRYFTHPMLLESHLVDPNELHQPKGGFTGIQLNVFPLNRINRIVNGVRKLGYKLPDARAVGDNRVANVHDPTGNVIMVVGYKERPDEALYNKSIGAVSVFVSSLARIRGFYEQVLGLRFAAAPHPGMLVFGDPGGTAVMLYQVARGLPETPVGRLTSYTLGTTDMAAALSALERSEGKVVERLRNPTTGEVDRAVFRDSDGNTFNLADELALDLPKPLPVPDVLDDEPPELGERGALLELDDAPAPARDSASDDDEPTFDRKLELD